MRDFGSSPRGRGKHVGSVPLGAQARLIPAWAGKTVSGPTELGVTWAHPRVGGENVGGDGGVGE